MPRTRHEHQAGHGFAQKFGRCIPVADARVWGFGAAPAHPRDPKSDSQPPSRCRRQDNMPVAAALRGGRLPSLTSFGCRQLFLDLCAVFELQHTPHHSSIGRNVVSFTIFYPITIHTIQLRHNDAPRECGPSNQTSLYIAGRPGGLSSVVFFTLECGKWSFMVTCNEFECGKC